MEGEGVVVDDNLICKAAALRDLKLWQSNGGKYGKAYTEHVKPPG